MLLAIVMVVGLVPGFSLTASAAAEITPSQPTGGDGSEGNPYEITTAAELYWFAEYVNAGNASACAKLMNDITVNENVIVNGALNSDTSGFAVWTPIGVRTKAFSGTFDGNNETISGLYVSATSGYQGLIGYMQSGTVKNVTVANSYFSGTTNIGAVVGCYGMDGVSTVTNCHNVNSVVIASDYYAGGVVGGQYAPATSHAQIVVSNCSNSGSVTGAKHYVGGIIGYAENFSEGTAISNCTNTGTITNTSTSRAQGTGGIAGYFGGSSAVKVEIVDCINSGTIQIAEGGKQDYMGGIIGQNSYGHISDCNNTGTISGYQYAGGIVGINSGTVTNCQNTGAVISTYAGIGGIAGNNNGTVTGCTNSADVQGQWYVGGIIGSGIGTGLSGCTNTGDVTSNTYGAGGVIGYVDTAGTVENCHNEGDVKGTYYIGGLVGHHYTGKVTYTKCSNKGAVEGSSQNVGGLFGRIAAGSTAKECYNTGGVTCTGTYNKTDNYGVGGLAGTTYNAVRFEDCYNTGSVNGGSNSYVGGLVGFFHYGSGSTENYIKRSYNTGSVIGGSYIGGLFGTYESNGVSEECYNTGSVNGNNYVGGLVGYRDYTGSSEKIIKNCYNTGSVSGTTNVGGLFGYSYYNNCLETSYNVGTVSGTSNFGGVIGNNKTVINCCYLDTCVTNGNTRTGATALTAEQMTDDANWQTNYAGFDTTTPVWSKQNNEDTKKYLPQLDSYAPTLHVHNWTYSAEGSTITATCNVDGCTDTDGGSVTVSAPTDLDYSGSSKDAVCTYTEWESAEPTIVYNEVDRVNVTDQDITASITLGEATASVSYKINQREITSSMVTLSPSSVTYDGSEKTVTVTVKYSSTTLTAGTDYEFTGTTSETEISTSSGYAVTVTGKGNYTGEATKYWKINKANSPATIITPIVGWTYLDAPIEPAVTNNPEDGEVKYIYYISYTGRAPTKTGTNNGAETAGGMPTYAGTYYVGASIVETEHYKQKTISPSASTEFVISPRVVEVTKSDFVGLQATYLYDNGNAIEPTFTLKDDQGNEIPAGEYTVNYTNNTVVGTATITITDNDGGNYTVSDSTTTFEIVTHSHDWKYELDGADTIKATCTATGCALPEGNGGNVSLSVPGTQIHTGSVITPVEISYSDDWAGSKDLEVAYTKNTDLGTATGTLTLGTASVSVNFDIVAKITLDVNGGNGSYDPILTDKDGKLTGTLPTDVTHTTLFFNGWYDAAEGGNKIENDHVFTESTIIYAQFISHQHSWTYVDDVTENTVIATCTNCVENGNADFSVTITLTAPEKEFYGDNKSADATVTQNPENSIADLPAVQYIGTGDTIYVQSTTAPTSAGTYIATLTLGESDNTATAEVTYTISEATPGMTVPTATNPTYNGEKQALVTGGNAVNGTMWYAVTDGTVTTAPTDGWNIAVPTESAAKTYRVWYKVVGNANYSEIAPNYVDSTISKNSFDATVSITGWTYGSYDEAVNKPSVSNNPGTGEVIYYYKLTSAGNDAYTTTVPTAADDYTVKAVIAETDNYGEKVIITTFTISKKPINAVVSAENKTYDGTRAATVTATVNASDLVSGDSITITGLTGEFDTADVGNGKTVTVGGTAQYGGTGYANYSVTIPTTTTANITQKSLADNMLSLDSVSFTFDGSEKTPVLTVKDTLNQQKVTLTLDTDYTVDADSQNSGTNVGTYAIKITGSGNYTGSTSIKWTITKNTLTGVSAENVTVTYDGKPHGLTIEGADNTMTVYYGTSEDNCNYSEPITCTDVADSKTIWYKVVSDNYEDFYGSAVVTINAAEITVTPDSNQSKTYGEADPELTYSYSGNVTGETPAFTGVLSREDGADVGDYEINIGTLALSDNGEFKAGNYTLKLDDTAVTFAITQASPTITIAKGQSTEYDSEAVTADTSEADVIYVYSSDGSVTVKWYVDNNGARGDEIDAPETVGTYWIGVSAEAGTNYTAAAEVYESFQITAKDITVTITANGGTYGSTITPAEATLHDVVSGDTVDVTLTYTGTDYESTKVPTEAGTYIVTVSISNDNYRLTGTATAEFVVAKADSVITTNSSITAVYGDAITLNAQVGVKTVSTFAASPDPEQDQVAFYCNETETLLGTAEVQNGKAVLEYNTAGKGLVIGKNTIIAYYGGSVNLNGTNSSEIVVNLEAKPVTVSGLDAVDRDYDGTTAVVLSGGVLTDILDCDESLVSADIPDNGTVQTKDIGENKTVSLDEIILKGDAKAYYTLTQPTVDVTITAKDITVTITAGGGTYGEEITSAIAELNGVEEVDTVPVTLTYTGTSNDGTEVDSTTAPVKAGTYRVTVTISDNNYNLTGTVEAAFIVLMGSQEIPTLTAVNETVSDKADGKIVGVTDAMEYSTDNGVTWLPVPDGVTVLENLSAGEYLVRYEATDNSNASDPVRVTIGVGALLNITFETNGGSEIAALTLSYNAEITEPAQPEKTGYDFIGWYTDEALTQPYSFPGIAVEEITLYAKWEKSEELLTLEDAQEVIESVFEEQTTDGGTPVLDEDITEDEFREYVENILEENGFEDVEVIVDSFESDGSSIHGTVIIQIDDISITIDFDLALKQDTLPIIPKLYSLTVSAGEGGTISPAGNLLIAFGASRTFRIVPDEGYEIADVRVNGRSVGAVSKYELRGAHMEYVVEATFRPLETVIELPFTDVTDTDWFYEDVEFVSETGLMNGTSETTFSPATALTRAVLVTALWRLEGEPVVNYIMPFTDIADGEWYTEAVRWAASEGIVNGYEDNTFRHDREITREQVMVILHRYAAYKELDSGMIFPMIPQYNYSLWAENDILWADMVGLTSGIGADIYDMTAYANRAEIAAYLRRFCEAFMEE